MLIGCYYRCPIVVEEGDRDHPRFYVLAQLVEYNEIADAVKVKMHDLLGSSEYYREIFQHNVFFAQAVTRCEASPGGIAEGRWGRGTIVSRASEPYSEDEPYWYWIKLPNGKHVKECETELKFDYSQMNYSPVKQLRAYEFQHPTWFINHLKVSKNLHLVNNATYGFRVLAGCRAFLLPHQISTVARCFETTPVRYMLADEVGLGKTVEACSILSILASENKDLRVLIIVPGALASQWKNELHYKYGLDAAFASPRARICILPMEDIGQSLLVLSKAWDLAIVDETHRLLANDAWYSQVQNLSRRVTHILLLSATPIKKAMAADTREAATVVGKLQDYIGELTQENLIASLSAIQDLFAVFAANGIIGSAELRVKYDKPPIDTAKDVIEHVKLIADAASVSAVEQLTAYSSNPLNALYDFLRDIQVIAQKATQEEAKARKDIENTGGFAGTEALSEAALASLEALYTQLENMEVYENAAN